MYFLPTFRNSQELPLQEILICPRDKRVEGRTAMKETKYHPYNKSEPIFRYKPAYHNPALME